MMAGYLAVTLAILAILGVSLSAVFKNQYISEKEDELRREAEEINTIITVRYVDDAKRPVAKEELLTISRKYDAVLQLWFRDEKLGHVTIMDADSRDKWIGLEDVDFTEQASGVLSGEAGVSVRSETLKNVLAIPVMTLMSPITDDSAGIIAAMFLHTDTSRTQASIEEVTLDVVLFACMAVLVAFVIVSYFTSRVTRPITNMNNIVMKFSRGDFDARVPVKSSDEVGQLAQSFNLMANELNSLEQSRRSFVANVSHELRSPLTSMRGFLEAMRDGTVPKEEFGVYLDIVTNEATRMAGMINDLLDLARIESGQQQLNIESIDINELIVRTLLTFEQRINEKNIEVDIDFDKDKAFVDADSAQIAHVVRNLVDNAIKFMQRHDGKLFVTTRTLKHDVAITIRDNGVGIAPEDIPHVFDRFYKGEKAHTPSGTASSGLGLSIVKRIIEQHDGDITVKTPKNGGTEFTFRLRRSLEASKIIRSNT